jgi:hypothetical protein
LDCNKVEIGDRVLFGPNVSLFPATHPIQPEERAKGPELAFPIKVFTLPIKILTPKMKIILIIFKQSLNLLFYIRSEMMCGSVVELLSALELPSGMGYVLIFSFKYQT